ncbi:MAG: hypothetical protein IIB62_06375 [Proteobacteria bacterium]|nr:hypothetical protein [Pseudomonadota bacterium]
MKRAFASIMVSAALVISLRAAYACNHAILCPDQWVWPDAEGTCVEAVPPTM